MKKFVQFYDQNSKKHTKIQLQLNRLTQHPWKESRITTTLHSKQDMHKYVIGTLFKHLYAKVDKEIAGFHILRLTKSNNSTKLLQFL
jgi:hypothetical protein